MYIYVQGQRVTPSRQLLVNSREHCDCPRIPAQPLHGSFFTTQISMLRSGSTWPLLDMPLFATQVGFQLSYFREFLKLL